MTPIQTQTLAELLGVDLASVDSDRLIELCILHRANPKARETFPAALKAELERRYDAAAIRADDTGFAVLERFSQEFQSTLPYFALKLREMAASVNRDIWFNDNRGLLVGALNDTDVAAWIAQNPDILTKILHSSVALPLVAQSETASKAILTRAESLAIWKDTPKLWEVWPQHAAGMGVVVQSGELMQYIIDTNWNAIMASQTAINAVAASSAALKAIVNHKAARDALIANNDKLQTVRTTMYDTVKNAWTKVRSVTFGEVRSGVRYHANNSQLASPDNALIFVCLGSRGGYTNGRAALDHPDGSTAANGGYRDNPQSMIAVDAVSFAGAKFKQTVDHASGYAEVYAPN